MDPRSPVPSSTAMATGSLSSPNGEAANENQAWLS
jgi:hypothetical protein